MLSQEEIFYKYVSLVKEVNEDHREADTDFIYAAYNNYANNQTRHNLSDLICKDSRLKAKDKDPLIANIFALDIENSISDSIQINGKIETIKAQQLKEGDLFVWCDTLSACTSILSNGNITIADLIDNYSLLDDSGEVSVEDFNLFYCFKIGTFKL